MSQTPYYDEDGITIYHGDCRLVLPELERLDSLSQLVSLLVTDPPYGISWDTAYGARGMSQLATSHDYPPVYSDEEEFDPRHLLMYGRCILFGANHYARHLPHSAGWLVWDKDLGMATSDLSDAELAWTNVTGGVRVFRHLWKGMLKDSERIEKRVHPTQKPVALFHWILEKWAEPGNLILDPYMGSGPIAKAARDMDCNYIGIEIEERYCEIAVERLAQGVLEFDRPRPEDEADLPSRLVIP